MAQSSMEVEATMEADLGDWNSRAVSPNTHPDFMWIFILPPSTYTTCVSVQGMILHSVFNCTACVITPI